MSARTSIEELDVIPAAQIDGAPGSPLNLGWSMYEGLTRCYGNSTATATALLDRRHHDAAQFEHTHSNGWNAIIGGQVYRGSCYPGIVGNYYFSDNGADTLEQAQYNADRQSTVDVVELAGSFPTGPSSIHADAARRALR